MVAILYLMLFEKTSMAGNPNTKVSARRRPICPRGMRTGNKRQRQKTGEEGEGGRNKGNGVDKGLPLDRGDRQRL